MIYSNKRLLFEMGNGYWQWALILKVWLKRQAFNKEGCWLDWGELIEDTMCLNIFLFKGYLRKVRNNQLNDTEGENDRVLSFTANGKKMSHQNMSNLRNWVSKSKSTYWRSQKMLLWDDVVKCCNMLMFCGNS